MYNKKIITAVLFIECALVATLIFISMNTYQTNTELNKIENQIDSVNAKLDSINQEVISTNCVLYD